MAVDTRYVVTHSSEEWGKWHKKWRREWFDIVERWQIRFADHLSFGWKRKLRGKSKAIFEKGEWGREGGVGIWRITSTRCVIVNAAPRYRGLELREKNFRLAREEKAFAGRIERKIGKWFIASFAREIRCIFATVRFCWEPGLLDTGFYLHTRFLIKFPPSFDYGPMPRAHWKFHRNVTIFITVW